MGALGVIGLLIGIVVLIYLSYKGHNVVFAAVVAAIVVIALNGMNLWTALSENFAVSLKNFVGAYFLLFVLGAIYGEFMKKSGSADSVARTLIRRFGEKYALLSTIVVIAVLSYGGINAFVIIFAVYPLALQLFKKANISKDLMPAVILFAAVTLMLPAPGIVNLTNATLTTYLGTTIYAGTVMGIICIIVEFFIGYWYLSRSAKQIAAAGHGFVSDEVVTDGTKAQEVDLPPFLLSVVPIVVVLATVFLTRGRLASIDSIDTALLMGSVACLLCNWKRVKNDLKNDVTTGITNSLAPIFTTAAIVGFGGVVMAAPAFQNFVNFALTLSNVFNPYISGIIAINVFSGITGGALTGITLFANTLMSSYLPLNFNHEAMHRILVMAAGGLDTLPHCSTIAILYGIIGCTHKGSYKYIFVLSVLLPLFGAFLGVGLALLGII